MVVEAEKYEGLLRATGPGSFGRLEYASPMEVVLRMMSGKAIEGTSVVRVYFDGHRNQVSTGRLYEPMPALRPFWFRPGFAYRITSHVEVVKEIPEGVCAVVAPTPESYDHVWIEAPVMRAGFRGPVFFMAHPVRRVEMEYMVTMCSLVFHVEGVLRVAEGVEEDPDKAASLEKGGEKGEDRVPARRTRSRAKK